MVRAVVLVAVQFCIADVLNFLRQDYARHPGRHVVHNGRNADRRLGVRSDSCQYRHDVAARGCLAENAPTEGTHGNTHIICIVIININFLFFMFKFL